jgi:hypothetical protein
MTDTTPGAHTVLFDDDGRDLRTYAPGVVVDEGKCEAPGGLDIFSSRGIIPPWHKNGEIARARGYVRYEKGDPESVFLADDRLSRKYAEVDAFLPAFGEVLPDEVLPEDPEVDEESEESGRRRRRKTLNAWVRDRASFCGGWAMPKYAILTPDEAHAAGYDERYGNPLAQLRPDEPIPGRSWGHDHAGMRHHKQHTQYHAAKQVTLLHPVGMPCSHCRRADGKAVVHRKAKAPEQRWRPCPVCGHRHREPIECAVSGCARHHRQDGPLCPCGGRHPKAKEKHWYQRPLPPGSIVRERHEIGKHHRHPDTGEVLVPLKGAHRHRHMGKYQLTPGSSAKRFDRHPLAAWDGIELAAIVLEGTPKNDSVVEWGRRTSVRIGVIDTASVTTWDALRVRQDPDRYDDDALVYTYLRELAAFAERHLQGIPTLVICDSDWVHNSLVRAQAFAVVEALDGYGVQALACAPEEGEKRWTRPDRLVMRTKVGVDDHLADPEHDLLDLVARERTISGLEDWERQLPRMQARTGPRHINADLVKHLTRLGRHLVPRMTNEGEVRLVRGDHARLLEISPDAVDGLHSDLARSGLLEIASGPELQAAGGHEWMEPAIGRLRGDKVVVSGRMSVREWLQMSSRKKAALDLVL